MRPTAKRVPACVCRRSGFYVPRAHAHVLLVPAEQQIKRPELEDRTIATSLGAYQNIAPLNKQAGIALAGIGLDRFVFLPVYLDDSKIKDRSEIQHLLTQLGSKIVLLYPITCAYANILYTIIRCTARIWTQIADLSPVFVEKQMLVLLKSRRHELSVVPTGRRLKLLADWRGFSQNT